MIRQLFALLIVFGAVRAHSAGDAPDFRFAEQGGPYAVGLKVVEQYDYSRTFRYATDELGKPFTGERARPLQTLVWYPTQRGVGTPMTVGDYADLMATETTFGKRKLTTQAREWKTGLAQSLQIPMWAVRDAPFAKGRFPVVIYAPSFSSPAWENADLCEYLASYGYIVIAAPSLGPMTGRMTHDVTGINAQAQDISFLIGYSQTLLNADASSVAVAGFSWGGISNLFSAARDNRIDALIALDGSMRYFPHLVDAAGDVHPEQMKLPLLFFAQGNLTLETYARRLGRQPGSRQVLNEWMHGDLIMVQMLGLTHQEHSSMFQRNERMWRNYLLDKQTSDYGREEGIAGYAWIARYVREFLDAYLKNAPAAHAFLRNTPARNGVPKYWMRVDHRPASGAPASFEHFRSEVGRQGFDRVADVYVSMQSDAAHFKPQEPLVLGWADELVDAGHAHEALELLKWLVQIYPDSSNAHLRLGSAYQQLGEKHVAINNYRRAVEIDPFNADAKRKLDQLNGGVAAAR